MSVLLLIGLGMAGCARYHPQPLEARQSAAALTARSLDDPALRAFLEQHGLTNTWPRREWDFPGLTLAAFYFSPDLNLARAQVREADAALRTAGQRPNPTASVLPLYDVTTGIPSPWVIGVDLDVPIETAGKRGHRLARARHQANAARLRLLETAWQVQTRVRRAMVELQAAQAELEALQAQQAAQQEQLRLLEAHWKAGAITPAEVSQQRIAWQTTTLALQDARQRLSQSRIELARAIGLPVTALDAVTVSFHGLDTLPADWDAATARRQALWRRADILAALSDYAAADAELRLELARQYPDIHLNPGYEFDQGDNKWGLGLSVELPVLNQNPGPIAEAEARRAKVGAAFLALQADVLAEIDRALAAWQHAQARRAQAEALVAESEQQLRRLEARLHAGDISRLELAAGRVTLASARLAFAKARADWQRALTDLAMAMQTPADLRVPPEAFTGTSPTVSAR